MKKEDLDGYFKKLKELVGCYFHAQKYFYTNIKPQIKDNSNLSVYWQGGASTGILLYFLNTLTSEEKVISSMAFGEIAYVGVNDGEIDVINYIDASLTVLEQLGYHLPLPQTDWESTDDLGASPD